MQGLDGPSLQLAVDTAAAYTALLLVNAATFLIGALIISRITDYPPTRPASTDEAPLGSAQSARWIALRDRRYLALTAAAAVASLQYFVLTIGLPLWIVLHTAAPRWVVAATFLIACLLVAALQVPATRSITGPVSAARLIVSAGGLFVVAWGIFALAGQLGQRGAIACLLAGVAVHSLAEVWQAGGVFELSFALASPEARGQYQGVFGLSMGVAEAAAPIVVVFFCVTLGGAGWLVLASIVAASSAACGQIGRKAHQADGTSLSTA